MSTKEKKKVIDPERYAGSESGNMRYKQYKIRFL